MIIDASVTAHNTNLLLNADKVLADKANISLELAEAISDYFSAFYYTGRNVSRRYSRMLRIARENNLTFEDCKRIYNEKR